MPYAAALAMLSRALGDPDDTRSAAGARCAQWRREGRAVSLSELEGVATVAVHGVGAWAEVATREACERAIG